METNAKSIYEVICNSVTEEGTLPKFFCPQWMLEEEPSIFAPGAMDGIMGYHGGGSAGEECDAYTTLKEAIDAADAGDLATALEKVDEFSKSGGYMQDCMEAILDYMDPFADGKDSRNIQKLGMELLLHSREMEAVKFGMLLMLYNDVEWTEEKKQIIRTLAMADDFTEYAVQLIMAWENWKQEMFEAAKRVTGWGRIHILEYKFVDTEEKEDWIVLEGHRNDIMPQYTAVYCYRDIHFLDMIRDENLDLPHYRGLAEILGALFNEGPVAGISVIDEHEELLEAFMKATRARTDLEKEDYENLKEILRGMRKKDHFFNGGEKIDNTDLGDTPPTVITLTEEDMKEILAGTEYEDLYDADADGDGAEEESSDADADSDNSEEELFDPDAYEDESDEDEWDLSEEQIEALRKWCDFYARVREDMESFLREKGVIGAR